MVEAVAAARAARQEEEEQQDPTRAQSVRLTLLRGAEVMAQWKLKAERMQGEEREQLRELVTTRYHVAGSPEARTIARVIPPTFSAMVERAGRTTITCRRR